MSTVKDDARRQAAESEKARELAVEEAVTRVRRQVEESMSENYRCVCVLVCRFCHTRLETLHTSDGS